jgi:hypothetical protein
MPYKIVRMYQNRGDLLPLLTPGMRVPENREIKRGLTLEEAQAHCSDPETSSSTCKLPENVKRTEDFGPWFDGYDEY